MLLTLSSAGIGNQLQDYVFSYMIVQRYNQKWSILVDNQCEKGGYYCLFNELNFPDTPIYLYDGVIERYRRFDKKIVSYLEEKFGTKKIYFLMNEDIILNPNGEWSIKNPKIFDRYDIVCTFYFLIYDGLKEVLKKNRNDYIKCLCLKKSSIWVEYFKKHFKKNSVAVHVRTGKFGYTNDSIEEIRDYYEWAMKKILKKNKNAQFYIFTDNCDDALMYVGTNERIHYVSIFTGGLRGDIEELFCASLCENVILDDISSYSIWAEILGGNNYQNVITRTDKKRKYNLHKTNILGSSRNKKVNCKFDKSNLLWLGFNYDSYNNAIRNDICMKYYRMLQDEKENYLSNICISDLWSKNINNRIYHLEYCNALLQSDKKEDLLFEICYIHKKFNLEVEHFLETLSEDNRNRYHTIVQCKSSFIIYVHDFQVENTHTPDYLIVLAVYLVRLGFQVKFIFKNRKLSYGERYYSDTTAEFIRKNAPYYLPDIVDANQLSGLSIEEYINNNSDKNTFFVYYAGMNDVNISCLEFVTKVAINGIKCTDSYSGRKYLRFYDDETKEKIINECSILITTRSAYGKTSTNKKIIEKKMPEIIRKLPQNMTAYELNRVDEFLLSILLDIMKYFNE